MDNGYIKAKATLLQRMRPLILERDNHRCVICDSAERLQIAHYLPLAERLKGRIPVSGRYFREVEPESWGELNDGKNLVTLCVKCHRIYDAHWWRMHGLRREQAKSTNKKIGFRIHSYLSSLYPPEPIELDYMPHLRGRVPYLPYIQSDNL